MDVEVQAELARIAERPPEEWPGRVLLAFPHDAALQMQALLWLRSGRDGPELEDEPPPLGDAAADRYQLLLHIARGATASVWQAFDRRLGRQVAIKVFHRANDSVALEQAIAEARAASDVISEHVVRILDVHSGEAHPYIVMELVCEYDADQGELVTGSTAAVTRPSSIEEALRWTVQVARGVHDAHARNVFHRDLKPRNVLVTPKSRRARVADFGLAVSSALDDAARPTLTLLRRGPTGPVSVRGTPAFMAPEQARGLPLALDARSPVDRSVLVAVDVWGLGALAYTLIGGRPPWSAARDDGLGAWELAASSAQPPELVRSADGRRVPRAVRRILAKAMHVDPRRRYATAAALGNDLQDVLDHRPTTLDRGVPMRVGLWCRRNPQLAMSAGILVALLVLVFVTHQAVARLRVERDAIAAELAAQRDEQDAVETRLVRAKTTLNEVSAKLAEERDNLTSLEHSLDEERASYQALLETKEAALRSATRTARKILDQLEAVRQERIAADAARERLERTVQESQRQAEKATKERDRSRREREAARAERDAAISERDAIQEELRRLKVDRARATRPPAARPTSETPASVPTS